MIRVLNVVGSLKIGGQENVGMNIARYSPKDIQVDFLVFDFEESSFTDEARSLSSDIYRIDKPNNSFFQFYNKIYSFFKTTEYDIVHIHTYFSSGFISLLAHRSDIDKIIVHSHTTGSKERKIFLRKVYGKISRSLINKLSDIKIAVSEEAGRSLFGESNFKVINNGIDINHFEFNSKKRSEIRKKYSLDNNLVVGHVGRLSNEKNQEFIIKLLPTLLKMNVNVKLLLVGGGDNYKEKLLNLVEKLGLHQNVIFANNQSDIQAFLSAMDVFVFPSLFEGMPLSLIEAQVNGLPIISSDNVDKNINLTNSIKFLSLNDTDITWCNCILGAQRTSFDIYKFKDFDVKMTMQSIYDLYRED